MRRYDYGDPVTLRYLAIDLDGEPVDATVAFTYVRPSGEDGTATPVRSSLGTYDVTLHADDVDENGPYQARWQVTGVIEDVETVDFYVSEPRAEVPPLASVEDLGRKLGYTPEESEYDRAAHILDEASELIRDVAGREWLTADNALDDVPNRIRLICVGVAYRAFTNPEGLTQRTMGDSSKAYDRSGREGGENVYLTNNEERRIRKAAGTSSLVSVTLVTPYDGHATDPWDAVNAE